MLSYYKQLIALRRELDGDFEMLPATGEVIAFRRGAHVVAVNLGDASASLPFGGDVVFATYKHAVPTLLAPRSGVLLRESL